MRNEENEMKDEDNNICELCHNVTSSFRKCENCSWIRCDDCLAVADEVVKETIHSSVCPNCGVIKSPYTITARKYLDRNDKNYVTIQPPRHKARPGATA